MEAPQFVEIRDPTGAVARVAPDLGGWLLRYARPMGGQGLVEALHWSQAVIDRYPKEMWAGNPILFPLVSFNHLPGNDHHYEWDGRTFAMPQHGFARRSKWEVISKDENWVTLELISTEETRREYPFDFSQRLSYRLDQGRLHWEQVIENKGNTPLPFSTGFHPYFQVPLGKVGRRDDCFIELPDAKKVKPSGAWERYTLDPFPAQNWSVGEDVSGTMFLTDLKKREVILVDPGSRLEVVFNFDDAPKHRFLAIWSKSLDAPFYCLEPWTALPNSFTRTRNHEVVLEPQRTFRAAMWVELREMA